MDQRLPRRSASHGTLRSSYSHQARPVHKPLKSVNENSVLLPSPGALESMLKTTTETGDIGIFSIKPMSGSNLKPAPVQTASATRQTKSMAPAPPRRPFDMQGRLEERIKMPVYRETTSEILSMNGSASQSSFSSTLSPSTEGHGQRSYSMTTVGSRHLSHQRSNNTMQSHASYSTGTGGNLQRPRSPFPYPTRLKRPGARPASPAVTEGGSVDYTRMVEIDRISLRTVHAPYKPLYPPLHPKSPCHALRTVTTQPATSLAYSSSFHGPLPMRHYPPGPPSLRTISAASMGSWNSPFRERLNSTASRTSSLTSATNGHHRLFPGANVTQIGPAVPPPRYYDYTEEFEGKETLPETIAPVPTRAPSHRQPLVLRDGSEEHLAAALGAEAESALYDTEEEDSYVQGDAEAGTSKLEQGGTTVSSKSAERRLSAEAQYPDAAPAPLRTGNPLGAPDTGGKEIRDSDIDLLPSQIRVSLDTFRPSLDLESRQAPPYSYPGFRVRAASKTRSPPGRQIQVHGSTPTIRSEQGVILRDSVQEDGYSEKEGSSDGLASVETASLLLPSPQKCKSYSETGPDLLNKCTVIQREAGRRKACMDPSDMCTPQLDVQSNPAPEHAMPNNTVAETSQSHKTSTTSRGSGEGSGDSGGRQGIRRLPSNPAKEPDTGVEGRSRFVRRHKRNNAVLRIRTKSLSREGSDGFPRLATSCSATPLISPQPISPARELRVKNSIPQLMKALPPIPGDAGHRTRSTSDSAGEDYAEVLVPFRFSCSSTPRAPRDSTVMQPGSGSESIREAGEQPPKAQRRLPKIRLKQKGVEYAKISARDSRPWNSDSNYPWCSMDIELESLADADESQVSVRRSRIRLRQSRTVTGATPTDTVRRHRGARRSDVVAGLATERPTDLFTFSNGLASVFRQASSKFSRRSSHDNEKVVSGHATSPTKRAGTPRSGRVTPSAYSSLKKSRAFLSTVGRDPAAKEGKPIRQLRKGMSNLRWLVSKSSHDPRQSSSTAEEHATNSRRTRGLTSTVASQEAAANKNAPVTETEVPQPTQRLRMRRRVRARLSKWVKHTTAAVKVW